MATLEQLRATFALEKVRGEEQAGRRGKYLTELKDLPARLHTGGLAQTMATYLAAGNQSVRPSIYLWLQEWLRRPPVSYPGNLDLISAISGNAVQPPGFDVELKYREASVEARALATWLKKFAEAYLA